MNSETQNAIRELAGRVEQIDRLTRRIPSRFTGGGALAPIPYFSILGGNTLLAPARTGIVYRSDTVAASELPNGVGSGLVQVPAWPIPSSLPDGVGVARRVGSAEYYFVLNDSTNLAGVAYDLLSGQSLFGYATFVMDKISGADTYRYTFIALEGLG